MRVVRYKKFLAFAATLFILFFLAPFAYDGLCIKVASGCLPLWKLSNKISSFWKNKENQSELRIAQLEAENYLLRAEVAQLQREENTSLLGNAIQANIIYRDPTTWNSSLWIDVGSHNKRCKGILEKNSCVLVGKAVVGLVDYVGKKNSRVRLLTDRKVHPSVRSVRGELKNQAVIEHLDKVIAALGHSKEYAGFFERIKKRLEEEKTTLYLAKGYLQGAASPLWRKVGAQLTGSGFNYDFSDKQGSAKRINLAQPDALLQEGDLLVTTGMDGLFPPDLFVAFVTKVYPLKEGDVCYQIEAKPYVAHLDRLQSCTIIPPLSCDALKEGLY